MATNAGKILVTPKGDYNPATEYKILDTVRYSGKTWVCKQICTGQTPAISVYWDIWCEDGIDGIDGIDGEDGADGTNTYTYIRYSASADGAGFVDTPTISTIYIGFYAGTSATAPTDKTAYAWSKYVGESGSGTGDMLKSQFATNGSAGVVDTSNRLRKYVTKSSGSTYENQWTKIATITFAEGSQSEHVIFSVINGVGTNGMGVFSLVVRVGSTVSTHIAADLNCISADEYFKTRVGTLKIVYTTPTYELWFNPTNTYSELHISVLNEMYRGVGFTWLENQPYQATQPTGTVVTATLMEDYLITDLTAETAIADADYFMMHDTSAVANRKTLWSAIKSVLKTYFDTLYNNYVLPTATASVKGGVKVDGTTITITDEVISSVGVGSGTVINDGSSNPIATTNLIDTITGIVSNTTENQVAGALAVKTLEDRFTYSTEEKVIGTWIDGKPLYQKTIDCGALPNSTSKNVAHGISNLKHIFYWDGGAASSTGLDIAPIPWVSIAANTSVTATPTNLVIATSTDRSAFTLSYVTIRYTKTTD